MAKEVIFGIKRDFLTPSQDRQVPPQQPERQEEVPEEAEQQEEAT